MRGGYNNQVNRDAEISESLAKPHELSPATLDLRLDDEQVQIAIGMRVASRARTKQNYLGTRSGLGETATSLRNQRLVSHK